MAIVLAGSSFLGKEKEGKGDILRFVGMWNVPVSSPFVP
jgi:hypothetical protein